MNNPKTNKTITFFDFAPLNYGGGCEKNFMKFGLWLETRGYKVNFVTPSFSFNKKISILPIIERYKKNINDEDLKDVFGVQNYITFNIVDLVFPTKIKKELKEIFDKSDVIISKNEIFEVFLLKLLFVKFNKVVFGFHTPIFYPITHSFKSKLHNILYNSKFYFNLIKDSKVRCLVLTDQDKQLFTDNHIDKLVKVIPNPLDINKFYEKEYKKGKYFEVYYIGRMTEQKGIDTLVTIIEKLSKKSEFKYMKFHFIGSGELDSLLINISKKYENCFFEGFTNDMVNNYHKADLVVAPSRWEGFPYSVLESQSCGVPVVSSNISGCRDIILENITGWLCEIENINDYVKKIINAYNVWDTQYSNYIIISKRSRRNIVENYEENKINQKIIDFIFSNKDTIK